MAYSEKPGNARVREKLKFYSHYHWFLAINALLLFFSLRNGTGFGWLPISIIWGSILVFHFMKVFRPEIVHGPGAGNELQLLDGPQEEEYFELRELRNAGRREWKDTDLV